MGPDRSILKASELVPTGLMDAGTAALKAL
jgi:hypothetical protein